MHVNYDTTQTERVSWTKVYKRLENERKNKINDNLTVTQMNVIRDKATHSLLQWFDSCINIFQNRTAKGILAV